MRRTTRQDGRKERPRADTRLLQWAKPPPIGADVDLVGINTFKTRVLQTFRPSFRSSSAIVKSGPSKSRRVAPRTPSLILILLVCTFAGGCDRDFGSPPEPTVEVLEPDLSIIQADSDVQLVLDIESPREIDQVTVNGKDLSFDTATSTWTALIPLDKGLNTLQVRSFIGDDPPFTRDLEAFRGDVTIEELESVFLPGERGGHAVARLPNGDLMLMGGSTAPGGQGNVDILLLENDDDRFRYVVSFLIAHRVGHSLIPLPDGRVLILGGGYVGNIQSVDNLVEGVELYDPASETYAVAPVEGAPIRRMYHSTNVRTVGDRLIIDLIGGRGDIQYAPEPEIGIRRDLRSFEFRNDSLFAIHTAIGPFVDPLAGHSITSLGGDAGEFPDRYLVAGMTFEQELMPAALTIDYASPVGIDIRDASPPEPGRIRHAAAPVGDGLVALMAGRGEDPSNTTNRIDVYSEQADAWFSVHEDVLVNFPARYGHTATATGSNRILVMGGFDAEGVALAEPHIVTFDFE